MPISQQNAIFTATSQCVSQLRNECNCAAKWHTCAEIAFAIAKYPAEWDFCCEIRALPLRRRFAATKWRLLCCKVALVCQTRLRSCENSRRESQSVVEWFGNKMLISKKFSLGCEISQSSVFALFSLCFCSDFDPIFFLSVSLKFLPPGIIQKD